MCIHGFLDRVIHVACVDLMDRASHFLFSWMDIYWMRRNKASHFLFGWMVEDSHADYVIRDLLVIYLFIVKT